MNVKDLMSISGKGGLFRYLAQARNGIVVESLTEKKRTVAPPSAQVSALEDISIFTENEDVPLADVLFKIHEKEAGGTTTDPKSENEQLKAYFAEVLPEYDAERVYVSDIKKVLTWYNLLHELGLLEVVDKDQAEPGAEATESSNDANKEAGDAGAGGDKSPAKAKDTAKKDDKKKDGDAGAKEDN